MTTPWQKARKSDADGNCIEVRRCGDHVEMRHSKDATGPVLTFTPAEFDAFLDGARNTEFDHLLGD